MSSLPPASLACSICSEPYKPSDEIISTVCGHVFHQPCLQDWQKRSYNCPDCRTGSPQTYRLYLHFEDHTEAERQLHESKTELISKVTDLERQLSESEANFYNALGELSKQDDQLKVLRNEIEYRKAQNESYEHEINELKQKQNSGAFDKDFYSALEGLKINTVDNSSKDNFDNSMECSPIINIGAVSLFEEYTDTSTDQRRTNTREATRTIFATKFAPETTEHEIKHYIQEKLPHLSELTVFKFPAPSFRRICSFRITVPESFYDIIVDSSFWPEFTFVREFFEKPRCVVLPEIEHSDAAL